jgi:hypothetical protein
MFQLDMSSMNDRSYKQSLLELMSEKISADFPAKVTKTIESLNASELAYIFVDVAFLVSAIKFVGEERWVQNKASDKEIPFPKFIKKLLKTELTPVLFMHDFFEHSSPEIIEQSSDNATMIEKTVVQFAKTKSPAEQKTFASTALRLMSELFEFEHQMNMEKQELGLHLGLSLYRTFDMLDEIFNLDYLAEKGMVVDPAESERLFENSGVGVQSSYSTALVALRYLNPAKGSRFVDLGSGYGRIGLVVGLMRPDINFVGYEHVNHRVDIAASASLNLGMSQHVRFSNQDLSSADFQIPIAETYYIYDSFSDSTYQHILPQLAQIARQKKITIITKGNARQWLENPEFKRNWGPAQQFDNGNLCFFRSR